MTAFKTQHNRPITLREPSVVPCLMSVVLSALFPSLSRTRRSWHPSVATWDFLGVLSPSVVSFGLEFMPSLFLSVWLVSMNGFAYSRKWTIPIVGNRSVFNSFLESVILVRLPGVSILLLFPPFWNLVSFHFRGNLHQCFLLYLSLELFSHA